MEHEAKADPADGGSKASNQTTHADAPEKSLAERLREIRKQCAELPDVDTRSPEEIIGYDDKGMW